MTLYNIVTIDGDGIGPEVCKAAVRVLTETCGPFGWFEASSQRWPIGSPVRLIT